MPAPPTFVLRLHGDPPGPWTVSLGPPGDRPATGVLDRDAVARLRTAVAATTRAPSRVLVPGRDHRQVRAEAEAGQLLLAATSTSPELIRAWGHLAAAFAPSGGAVVVDAHPLPARSLPWELLSHTPGAPPMAFADRTVVARLCPAPPRPVAAVASPRPALWCLSGGLDPTDPIAADVLTQLEAAWGGPLAPPSAGQSSWLHVVAHGTRAPDSDHLALVLDGRQADGSSAMDQLAPHLPGAAGVLLAVCHAGTDHPHLASELPTQLIQAGAGLVVAADRAVSPAALGAFARGLATGRHDTPLAAVAAGWRTVRAAALPWPDARWHRLRVFVPRAAPLRVSLLTPQSPVEALLAAARAHATTLRSGYCGLEHLLLAIRDVAVPRELEALRYRAGVRRDQVLAQLAGLQPHGPRPSSVHWSPRLDRLLRPMPPSLIALWTPLLQQCAPLLHELLDLPALPSSPAATFDTVGPAPAQPLGPATTLEVLGGPQDGLILRPTPGDTIGRPSTSAPSPWPLYAAAPLVDPRLSRRHLRWDGPGRLHLHRPGRIGTGPSTVGPVCLAVGEVLHLGGATRLRGGSASA